ncbi:MAG: hypothetical protein RLZZ341_166, partial [Pseudomonadota bacterium]
MFADKLEQALPQTDVKHVVITRVPEFFPAVVGGIVHAVMNYWNRQIPRHGVAFTALPQALAQGAAAGGDVRAWWAPLTHDSLALLQYTGGTTGVAKGAMLTHGNLLWNLAQMRAMVASHLEDGKEVVLTALPLY